MIDTLPTDESRAAQRVEFGLFDLGLMPAEVRDLAYAWGGTTASLVELGLMNAAAPQANDPTP
jgi:hypothetical protein